MRKRTDEQLGKSIREVIERVYTDFVPPSFPTEEQINKLRRSGLCMVVELMPEEMAEEVRKRLLGFPRYEKCNIEHLHITDPTGFSFAYAMTWRPSERETESNYLAFFRDKETCDLAIELFNKNLR